MEKAKEVAEKVEEEKRRKREAEEAARVKNER